MKDGKIRNGVKKRFKISLNPYKNLHGFVLTFFFLRDIM